MGLFEIATRAKSKARIALTGSSGSGKTLSALYLAYGFTNDWSKIALVDTEHERGRFYANRDDLKTGAFLYASLTPPYSAERYITYVTEASKAVGEDGVVIIDSFSHAWDNEGGVLDLKSQVEKQPGKTSFSAWDEAGKVQNNLVNTILSVNCHTIITMRAKMAYAMEVNEKGKTVPVKIGLAPVQRENTEYEFDVCFQIAQNHIADISKDTTFLDGWSGVITPKLGSQLNCVTTASKTKSVQQIIDGSVEVYGRQLCLNCVRKLVKAAKENAAKTVSE